MVSKKMKGGMIWIVGSFLLIMCSTIIHEEIHVYQFQSSGIIENIEVEYYFIDYNPDMVINNGAFASVSGTFKEDTLLKDAIEWNKNSPNREYQAYMIQAIFLVISWVFLWRYAQGYKMGAKTEWQTRN